jgi:uncharacterized protein (DUF1778 family)
MNICQIRGREIVNTSVLTHIRRVPHPLLVSRNPRLSQLQIRVSEAEKSAIRAAAKRAGMDMSTYVLNCVLPLPAQEFRSAVTALSEPGRASFALADLNSLLSNLTATELRDAVASAPEVDLSAFLANYVSAMVETACARHGIPVPAWARRIPPLDAPVFGSDLISLRLHLVTHSPAAFRRRNIFIDSSIGDRL